MTRQFSCVFLFLVLCTMFSTAHAFDIAIYGDPLSYWVDDYLLAVRYHGYTGDLQTFLADSAYAYTQMESIYEWYREMGVTKVMVQYPEPWCFTQIPPDSSQIKVMNIYYPGPDSMRAEKYANAQFRDVLVGDEDANWSDPESIGESAERIPYQPPEGDERPVVAMSGSPDTLWQPESYLGNMAGWDSRMSWLDNSIYLPMHFKLTWAIDPNGAISAGDTIADFYWIVKIPDNHLPYYETGAYWWRFPVKTLTLDSLPDSTTWIVSDFYEDAQSGWYTVLDEGFDSLLTVAYDSVHHGLDDDVPSTSVSYPHGAEVRMAVYYRGTHAFYLNRIEVYDEGAWQMFALTGQDSLATVNAIVTAFQNEYNNSNGRSCGWYYDEQDRSGEGNGDPVLRSLVYVNKILQTHNLPTFIMNGHQNFAAPPYDSRTRLFDEEDRQGVHINVQMNEFYFLGGGVCTPNLKHYGWNPVEFLNTLSVSDTTYISVESCGEIPGNPVQIRYDGFRSVQCAIDAYLWGLRYATDSSEVVIPYDNPDDPLTGIALPYQTGIVHDHFDDQHWALLQGGQDQPPDSDWNCCPQRFPTPNEVKLSAWLAVASNVDGIMWYPWDFGGLIEWTGSIFDTTERFAGARDAGQDIQQLAPYLDSPDFKFVTTYASRAFETNYPDSTYEATYRDILANETWGNQPFRSVYGIAAYPPDGEDWSATPDSCSYVQVTRFRSSQIPSDTADIEDYWFLIVNRRALDGERRQIHLRLEIDRSYEAYPYYVECALAGSTALADTDPSRGQQAQYTRTIKVALDPGEAELVHFFRGALGCDTTEAQFDSTIAHVHELTALHYDEDGIRLARRQVTETDSGEAFQVTGYIVWRSFQCDREFAPIAVTTDTTYVDYYSLPTDPRRFYAVQACGTVEE